MSFEAFVKAAEKEPHLRLAKARVRGARMMAGLLTAMRKDAGLTQADVGKLLGVSQARISQVESGLLEHAPSIDFACAFAAACGGELAIMPRTGKIRPHRPLPGSPGHPVVTRRRKVFHKGGKAPVEPQAEDFDFESYTAEFITEAQEAAPNALRRKG